MADTIFLLQRAKKNLGGYSGTNGIQAMLLVADDAQTLSQNNATAKTKVAELYGGDPLPDNYFTEQFVLSTLMDTAGDHIVIHPHNVDHVIAE